MSIDWQRLWQHVANDFPCDPRSVHGPTHWRRVERNGLFLAKRTHAIVDVVRLFAVLHDSRREHDGSDNTHGEHAAEYAASLRGMLFDISDDHFKLLQYACIWHTHGSLSVQPTVGTCWDADRLDLERVGIRPASRYMSTQFGREIVAHDCIQDFIEKGC